MTLLLDESNTPDTPDASTPSRSSWSRQDWVTVVVAIAALIGLLTASYPAIAQWFSAKAREGAVTGYTRELQSLPDADKQALLENAHAYNDAMPNILLTDPYTMKEAGEGRGGAWELYEQQLAASGTDVMGRISIPAIDTSLPIYHGTDDGTLAKGVGHLFGSSLPVGGIGTHAVLTAHTAYTNAHLFDDLDQVEVGDDFFITVAGEKLAYRVDQIDVVLPTEINSLQLEDGKDYVTLVTCTPRAVNSHRLLVRGERIDLDDAPELRDETVTDGTTAGFPWWLLWTAGGTILITAVTLYTIRPDLAQRVRRPQNSDAE